MMSVFSFSLVFAISIFADFLLAFSLLDMPTETEGAGNHSTTEDSAVYTSGLSTGLGLTDKAPVTIGLTIVLLVLLIFGLTCFAKEWYHSSHGYTIERMRRKGKLLPRKMDPRIEYGLDGRPNWIDCFGPYEAQDAVDMINTLALSHHRAYYYNGPENLAMYAIKGRELNSVNHAFEGFPVDDRPRFKYLQSGEPCDDISWHGWRLQEDGQELEPEAAASREEDYSDLKAKRKDCSEEIKNRNSSDKEKDETQKNKTPEEEQLPDIKPTSHGDVAFDITAESVVKKISLCGLK